MDYLDVIAHYPLFMWHFAVSVWGGIVVLPWPSLADIFQSTIQGFIVFFLLWKPRTWAETHFLKRRFGHKRATRPPNATDHQAAASSSVFHHF